MKAQIDIFSYHLKGPFDMTQFDRFTPLIQSLPASVPFVGPETSERASGQVFKARLGANENGFGFSPLVQDVMSKESSLSWRYGDPESFELKTAIAETLDVDFDNIAIGEGIDSLLGLAVRMIVAQSTPVVTSLGAYPTFNFHVVGYGGQLHSVPYKNDFEDLDSLLAKVVEAEAPLVYLSNPDNPMGTCWPAEKITAFVNKLPKTTMLIFDEAYCELAPDGTIPDANAYLTLPNVIRMRTFSKVYGLAGLRIGYAIGHPNTIAMFDRVRNHFGMSRLSQKAAVAAISDQNWLSEVLVRIAQSRDRISEIAKAHGFQPILSATNFVTFDCGQDGNYARALLGELTAQGVFARMPGVAPLDRCIRISVAPKIEIDVFEAALAKAVKELA